MPDALIPVPSSFWRNMHRSLSANCRPFPTSTRPAEDATIFRRWIDSKFVQALLITAGEKSHRSEATSTSDSGVRNCSLQRSHGTIRIAAATASSHLLKKSTVTTTPIVVNRYLTAELADKAQLFLNGTFHRQSLRTTLADRHP